MRRAFIAILSLGSLALSSCGGNAPTTEERAVEAAKSFVYDTAEKADNAIESIKEELSSDEVAEFEQEFKTEVERLMAQLRADAEAFVERMQSGEDIEAIRQEVVAYTEGLSPEAAKEFMTSFSDALSKMIEGSELGL